jgi:rhodanese-related sulfurtransferase
MKSITADEFIKLLPDLSEDVAIVDVREEKEFESTQLSGSLSLPLSSIGKGINELKKYSKIYLLCESGGRSSYAHEILKTTGIETIDIEGGLLALKRLGVSLIEK